MIIPWGTDAPIYHRPIATVAVIVLNVASFFVFPWSANTEWTLEIGGGVHPAQWATNLFLHMGLGHLIGNMIFLWAFGIIVEGKLGALGFLAVYLGVGAGESALIQLLARPEEVHHMLGASGAIYGLMAICLVWAPRNDLNCIGLYQGFFFRHIPIDLEIPILWFAGFYIAYDVLWTSATQFAVSGKLAHVTGAVVGAVAALLLLRLHLVDCEGWDLPSLLRKRRELGDRSKRYRLPSEKPRKARKARKKKTADPAAVRGEDPFQAALRTLRRHLEAGEVEAALSFYKSTRKKLDGWRPPDPDWIELIKALVDQQSWEDSVSLMRAYLDESEFPSEKIRLRLADVLIRRLDRPVAGDRVLEGVPEAGLPPPLAEVRRKLAVLAEQKREEGVLEIDDEIRGV